MRGVERRNVFIKSSGGPNVHAAKIKAVRRGVLERLSEGRIARNCVHHLVATALLVPWRCDPHRDWPVAWVLPDRGVFFISQLIAPVPERDPEVIQFWPSLMTGRAGQAVLPRKRGDRMYRLTQRQKHPQGEHR